MAHFLVCHVLSHGCSSNPDRLLFILHPFIGSYPITSRRSACAPEALTGLSPAGFTQTIQNYVNTSLFIFIKIPTWATPNSYSCYSRLSAASCRNALFWYSLQAVGLPARSLQGSSGLSSQRLLLRPRDCYANIQ